ncbi:hypothetical protein MGN70_004146 [Eutypa lata]|nr:hypothetical protein MGN70_004146 [Eutypa lata]
MPAIKVGAVKQGTSQDSQKPILKETEFTVSSVISYVHGEAQRAGALQVLKDPELEANDEVGSYLPL